MTIDARTHDPYAVIVGEVQTALDLPTETATLSFYVAGKPQTAGSKTAIVGHRRDGTAFANVVDGGKKHVRDAKKEWRADLRAAAQQAIESGEWVIPEPEAALRLTVVIVRRRPSAMLGTGRNRGVIKDWAIRARPVARPDSLKLVRATEDALTGVVWRDDSVICRHEIDKVFGDQVDGGSTYDEGMRVEVAIL